MVIGVYWKKPTRQMPEIFSEPILITLILKIHFVGLVMDQKPSRVIQSCYIEKADYNIGADHVKAQHVRTGRDVMAYLVLIRQLLLL